MRPSLPPLAMGVFPIGECMKCPICPNTLKTVENKYVKCARDHKFEVRMKEDSLETELVLALPVGEKGFTVGQVFPVAEGTTF